MLTISNIYGHGFDQALCARMETLGFRMRPQVSTYMGTQLCRFIDFASGPALELIEVESEQAYLDFVPDGMGPTAPAFRLPCQPWKPSSAILLTLPLTACM